MVKSVAISVITQYSCKFESFGNYAGDLAVIANEGCDLRCEVSSI